VPGTAPLAQEAAVGAARPPDTGISPQRASAALSTAGLALSSELQASAAGASALGRGGDGAGPELMQCQRELGPADAAPLSTQDQGKQDKRWGETEPQEIQPAPCAVAASVPAPSLGVPPAPHLQPTTAPVPPVKRVQGTRAAEEQLNGLEQPSHCKTTAHLHRATSAWKHRAAAHGASRRHQAPTMSDSVALWTKKT